MEFQKHNVGGHEGYSLSIEFQMCLLYCSLLRTGTYCSMDLSILPIASSCCTEVSHHISRRLLERVNICRIQRADGDCDLAAVILHVRRRRLCVSPHSHVIKQWMKEQAAKKNTKGNICHKKQAGKRKSKGAHQEKPEIHSHKSPY
nr:C-C motif chemokine 28 [Vulpes vulpes]